jgi:glycosyltransferase involved in cell wall biosynthesis
VMVPAWPGQLTCSELVRQAAADLRPRTDYVELARALDADVMDMEYMRRRATRTARVIERRLGVVPAQVVEAFLGRRRFRHIVARADRLGLPLALLFKLARSRRDVVLVSAWLSRPKKAFFLDPLRVDSHLKAIVNYSSAQMEIAAERLGVQRELLHHALQPVDEQFWRPSREPAENVICAVGLEARDYLTLIEAVRGLDMRVELAVGTTVFTTGDVASDLAPWVAPIVRIGLPSNVVVHQQLDHRQLRRLYARARFVVLPLHDVDFDAGVTSIAEAMGMAKAVVVSRTRGQRDLVRDRENGLYVPPGDARALRGAIEHLVAHPGDAERMGRAGRAMAEHDITLDRWVGRVVDATLAG